MLLKDKSGEYKVLNCPFCNSDKLKVDKKANGYIDRETGEHRSFWRHPSDIPYGNFSVRCNKCHARGGVGHTFKEAINIWNKRDWLSSALDVISSKIEEYHLVRQLPDAERLFSDLKNELFCLEGDNNEKEV